MFKFLSTVVLALTLSFPACAVKTSQPVVQPKPESSVTAIQFNGDTFCTVFSINQVEGNWASAGHCALYAAMVTEKTGILPTINGKPAFVAYIDNLSDVSVFQSESTAPALKLSSVLPEVQDPIKIVGYPYGITKVVTKGFVGARNVPIPHPTYKFHMRSDILDVTVAGGNSGSPIFNSMGEVVGILWGGFTDSPHALGVPLESVKRALVGFIE